MHKDNGTGSSTSMGTGSSSSPSPSSSSSSSSSSRYMSLSPLESLTSLLPSFHSTPPPSTPSTPLSGWLQDPMVAAALSATATAGVTLGSLALYRRYWRRIRNADYVTSGMLDRKTWVRGVVTSVGDGDNFRLFHTPGPFYWPLKLRSVPSTAKELKDETLSIRIAGVDAPENAHFGNPAQPHAKESLEWLQNTLTGRRVRCQLLRKDQYNRIVGVPYISRVFWRDRPLPPLMLKEGMAVVYTAGGGEYGPWGMDGLRAIEEDAKRARRGLWASKKVELPGDYKRRIKGDAAAADADTGAAPPSRSFWSRLFGRR